MKTSEPLPGLALAAAVALAATLVNVMVPLLSAMLLAILVGVALRNTGLVPPWAEPGLRLTGRTVLRAGVVLLGLRLSVPAVLALGWGAVGVIVVTVSTVFAVTLWGGRLLRVPRTTALLTATGTAICGAAAVAGMSAVVDEDDDDVESAAATAIASVTLFGTLAIVVLPLAVGALRLGPHPAGVWVGAAVHEVGQVVAAGGLVSPEVLDVAVVAKLGRVVLLAPLVALVGLWEGRRRSRRASAELAGAEVAAVLAGTPVQHPTRRAPLVPLFVVGFLVMVAVRSVLDGVLPGALFTGAGTVASFLLTMAMFAMGAGVDLRRLAQAGLRSLGLGALAAVVSAVVSLAGAALLVQA